jgi:hypothetical protein
MIEPMYTVDDICALLRVKDPRTARKIMRQEMEHTEKPHLMVSERSVKAWFDRQTLPPGNEIRRILKRKGA